jgi:GntR family transcriptional regulator
MRLWLNRNAEVPLREQLITQVVLAILTREVLPGQRLPSTRELARRFGIHPNTASAAYRQLEQEGWLELRHGSGVFVSSARHALSLSPEMAPESLVDQLIGELAARARSMGASDALLRARLLRWLSFEPPARWLVIEPDPELCRIVMLEMEENLALPVTGCEPAHCASPEMLEQSIPVVLPSKAEAVRKLLPAGAELTVLQVQAITPALQAKLLRYLPEHSSDLVGIASRWAQFQQLASIMKRPPASSATSSLRRNSPSAASPWSFVSSATPRSLTFAPWRPRCLKSAPPPLPFLHCDTPETVLIALLAPPRPAYHR